MNMRLLSYIRISFVALVIVGAGLLAGCGGSSGGSGTSSGPTVLQGTFIDSAVEGLSFNSGNQSGTTDVNGAFSYEGGAAVQFLIGDVVIGSATAGPIMTPVDLVQGAADEMDSTVTNIARFLQTLDDDGEPNNGITITGAVSSLAVGKTIDFNQSIADFESDPNVQTVVNDLTTVTTASTRPLISSAAAQDNLMLSLLEILSGSYEGTFSGSISGTWSVVIDSLGIISGWGLTDDGLSFGAEGTVTSSGSSSFIGGSVSGGYTFTGTISSSGVMSGAWENVFTGESGTYVGGKI